MKRMETEGQQIETVGDAFSTLKDNLEDIKELYIEQKSSSERSYGAIGDFFDRWQYNVPSDLDEIDIRPALGPTSYRKMGRAFAATQHILDNKEDFKSMMDQIEDEILYPGGDKVDPTDAYHLKGQEWDIFVDVPENLDERDDIAVEDYSSLERAYIELSDTVNFLSKEADDKL